jgi:hypothetical protein
MKQPLSLEQSVFTSSHSFRTVARSAGLGAEVRKELEARSIYPKGWDGVPPLIFRGFPLSCSKGDHAVVRARYADTDSTGRTGNFIVHSYVVPGADFERVEGNLPWLSTYLGCATSVPAGDAELLPRAEVECDTARAFRFLRFVVPELTRDRTAQLVAHLLAHLSRASEAGGGNAEVLFLNLGEPASAERLHAWLRLVAHAGGRAPAPPGPDVLNVWRTAALFALLPRPFKRTASFSINEVSMVPGYTLVIQRTGPATACPPVPVPPYVERCLALVDGDRLEDLQALVEWLDEVMVNPSIAALDELLSFYDDVVVPVRERQPLSWPRAGDRWRRLRSHAPLRCRPVAAAAMGCLRAGLPWQQQAAVLVEACHIVEGSGEAVDDEVLDAAERLLDAQVPVADRIGFQRQLPSAAQDGLWRRARRGAGTGPQQGDRALSLERAWLLASLADVAYPRLTALDGMAAAGQVFDALARAMDSRPATGEVATAGALVALARTPAVLASGLRGDLAVRIHARLFAPTATAGMRFGGALADEPSRVHDVEACRVIDAFFNATLAEPAFPESNIDQALDVLLDFVRACWRGEPSPDTRLLARVLLAWPPPASVDRARRCARRVAAEARFDSARLVGDACTELIDLSGRGRYDVAWGPPPAHRRWVRERENGGGWRVTTSWPFMRTSRSSAFDEVAEISFYANVRLAITGMDPASGLALGVAYAEDAAEPLFETLLGLLRTHRERLSEAWTCGASRIDGSRFALTDVIARLLISADRLGSKRLEDTVRTLAALPPYASPPQHDDLARALQARRCSLEKMERSAGLIERNAGKKG